MKWIGNPPDWTAVVKKKPDSFFELFSKSETISFVNHINDRCLYWDELKYRPLPENLDREMAWALVKFSRMSQIRRTKILSTEGKYFWYWLPDVILRELHFIDQNAIGQLLIDDPDMNETTKDKYIVSSLMEEAIASSILEGAATTHKVAKEMLREGRKPRTRGEMMISNNYLTMQKIKDRVAEDLSIELLCEIQASMTSGTLDDPSKIGKLRDSNDIFVVDYDGTVLHTPPDAKELKERLKALCDFANDASEGTFVHPVIKASILHFWLGYIHPFVDGNGRTARALFYWYLLKNKYWLVEFIPVSRIILKAPAKYKMAYLYSEKDDNDLTYFIRFHLRAFHLSIDDLRRYISRKRKELQEAKKLLRRVPGLNHRQQELVNHAIRHPAAVYSIYKHMTIHGIVYQTARNDLLQLVKRGLLKLEKRGRLYTFIAVANLTKKLKMK
jgi:Fic family protein